MNEDSFIKVGGKKLHKAIIKALDEQEKREYELVELVFEQCIKFSNRNFLYRFFFDPPADMKILKHVPEDFKGHIKNIVPFIDGHLHYYIRYFNIIEHRHHLENLDKMALVAMDSKTKDVLLSMNDFLRVKEFL